MTQALAELRAPVPARGAPASDGGDARTGGPTARRRAGSPGSCARPTTPKSPMCGRWATTSTRCRRTARRACLAGRAAGAPPPRRPRPRRGDRGVAGRGRVARPSRPARENGQRLGLRFRRGSRGPLRAGRDPAHRGGPDRGTAGRSRARGRRARAEPGRTRSRRHEEARPARGRRGRRRAAAAPHVRPRPEDADCGGRRRRRAEANAKPTAGQEEGGMSATRRAATLPVSFFERPAEVVARELLGTRCVSTLGGAPTAGRIVETEAYLGRDDPASHGYRTGGTRRTRRCSDRRARGTSISPTAIHWCANLVCGPAGTRARCCCGRWSRSRGSRSMRERRGGVAGPPALLRAGQAVPGARDHPRSGRAARCGAPGSP